MSGSLAGLRVLVTRPAGQEAELMRLIAARGGSARHLPLFLIEASGQGDILREKLASSRDFDGWIFTSANAARIAAELDGGAWPCVFAIGPATARELTARGHSGAIVPLIGSNSESLLDLPALREVAGARFLICTGENDRGLLQEQLQMRGAHVVVLHLYRRATIEHEPSFVESAIDGCDALILTSAESLQRLWQITPGATRAQLLARQLVTVSPRVVELARTLGFPAPRAPAEVSDEALLRCLEQNQA